MNSRLTRPALTPVQPWRLLLDEDEALTPETEEAAASEVMELLAEFDRQLAEKEAADERRAGEVVVFPRTAGAATGSQDSEAA
ncbi:hypothetical protein [Sciscionella marina]|uniref:hypothetical protein n=1 Tax=Sciscionella marina TaxID=508770 RepID=UPI0003A350FF|nr:hypothetical protein [Sciscionella marina]